jgi:hypothetical protein
VSEDECQRIEALKDRIIEIGEVPAWDEYREQFGHYGEVGTPGFEGP